ncbi:MAG: hypothetical protein HY290_27080 [Planctomycetia bacterium]|nr:hypothetical protein [Planctomycetia bacterium]
MILVNKTRRLALILCLLAAGSLLGGCGGGTSTVESFHPEDVSAKDALHKALTAWQNGQEKPGTVPGSKPEIRVADGRWLNGAKLKSFEIGEPLDKDGAVQFPVKLTLEGASAPEEETYVVVGKDPLWVWTKAEYDRSGGM